MHAVFLVWALIWCPWGSPEQTWWGIRERDKLATPCHTKLWETLDAGFFVRSLTWCLWGSPGQTWWGSGCPPLPLCKRRRAHVASCRGSPGESAGGAPRHTARSEKQRGGEQCCRSRIFIPYPGFEYFPSRNRIFSKYFNPKKLFLNTRKYDPGCSSYYFSSDITYIMTRVSDPHWFNADPDTDPRFDDLKLKKIYLI